MPLAMIPAVKYCREGHPGGWPTGELERERLGFAASEAAEVILRGWQVPEVVVVGAAFADRPEALGDDAPIDGCRLADIVSLARLGTAARVRRRPRQPG